MNKNKEFGFSIWNNIQSTPEVIQKVLELKPRVSNITNFILNNKQSEKFLLLLTGCGTSYNAALFGEGVLTSVGIFAKALPSYELLIDNNLFNMTCKRKLATYVMAISHSGKTKVTLDVIRKCKSFDNVHTIAITCSPDAPIAKEADHVVTLPAREFVGPKTASFTACIVFISLLALSMGSRLNGINNISDLSKKINNLPNEVATCLKVITSDLQRTVDLIKLPKYCCYIASGLSYPIALESSLKTKEMAQIKSEGLEIEEVAHGTLASIFDKYTLLITMISNEMDLLRIKSIKKAAEMLSSSVIIFAHKGLESKLERNLDLKHASDSHLLLFPVEGDLINIPILFIIGGQLLAYFLAKKRNINPDSPLAGDLTRQRVVKILFPPGTH